MSVALRAGPPPKIDPVAALYRAHFEFVWQVLRKLGVEASAVEDATQDVFVVAHRRWADFRGESAPRTWLFSVARRVASRHRRTDARRRRRHAALVHVPPAEVATPDGVVAVREAWQQLLAFLDTLDAGMREAFVLGELEGLSRARLGQALGISPNTAYSRLRAARQRFAIVFPDAASRHCIREAAAPPSRGQKRRVWLLLTTGIPLQPLVPVVGVAVAMAIGGVAVMTEAPRTEPPVVMVAETERALSPPPTPPPLVPESSSHFRPPQPSLPSTVPPPTPPPVERPLRAPRPRKRVEATPQAPEASSVTSPPGDGLGSAMQLLVGARRALQEKHPDKALALLRDSERLDAGGAFSTERSVTRVWALCALRRNADARRELLRLQRSNDSAAYGEVLATSCVGSLISPATAGDGAG